MIVRQKSTGYFLTCRGGFRKGLTAKQRVATFHDPRVSSLASTTTTAFPQLCRQLGLDARKVELSNENQF
jgi:hypothetical protein